MNKKVLITACCLFMLLGTISAQGELEKAFTAISKLKGFKTYYKEQKLINGWGADNHLDCFSEVMTTCANADSQEQLLSILETIPKELLIEDIRMVSDDQKKKTLYVRFVEHVSGVYCDEIGVYCDETFILLCSSYVNEDSNKTQIELFKGCK